MLLLVQKARRRAAVRSHEASYQVARRHFAPLTRAFETLANALTGAIDKRALVSALEAGNIGAAVQSLPSEMSERDRRRLVATFEREYKAAVKEAGASEVKRLGFAMNFSLDNPYSVPWIERNAAELVTRVSADARETIRDVVANGFRAGNPPREMAREIEQTVGLLPRQALAARRYRAALRATEASPERIETLTTRYRARLLHQRAEMIARTETIAAEAQGILDSWMVARDEGLIIPGTQKQWIAAPSDRTCEVCEALDDQGPIDLADSWTDTEGHPTARPPAHPMCLPADALISSRGAVTASSERRYNGDFVVLVTASGNTLACTPNHPVLGGELGIWTPASAVNVGDYVISSRRGERVATIDDEHEHRPAAIHEIAKALRCSRQMLSREVPISAKHFHGDGKGSDVATIWADGLLRHAADAPPLEKIEKRALDGGASREDLTAVRSFAEFLERSHAPLARRVCRRCERRAFRHARFLHSDKHRARPIAYFNAALSQPQPNHRAADVPGFGQRLLSDTGAVFLDQVRSVNVQSFQGQILNIETGSGAYVANGVVTHNCRCSVGLVLP